MEAIFTYILKVNALIVLFYLVYQLALSKETFYKHSRWFLLSGLFVSVLLPLFTITRVEYYEVKRVLSNSVETNVPVMMPISSEVVQEPMLTNQEIMFLIYGIICFGFLLKTLFDFFKLFKIIKFSNSEKKNKLVYVNSTLVNTPFSFFNYIIFNEELINPVELQNIMKHEEAHSKQKHSFDTLLAHVFIILFWFNPIVWLYRKCIVQNLEFLADNYAIQHVSDIKQYQKTMLKITLQTQQISIINTFNQSSIKKRIVMLNTNQSNRKNAFKYAIVIPVLIAFIMLFQVKVIAKERTSGLLPSSSPIQNSQKYVIEKSTTDKELKSYSDKFKEEYKMNLDFKGVKRNADEEITAINITLDDNNGKKANQKIVDDKGIEPIHITVLKGENNAYSFAFGKNAGNHEEREVVIVRKSDKGEIEDLSELEDIDVSIEMADVEFPDMPEPPSMDFDIPTPPDVPNVPDAPTPPKNPNDKKAWAKFDKEMADFEQKMNNQDWKKYEASMKVFEEKMKAIEPKMKEFEKEMKVFEEKMKLQEKQIEKKVERKMKKIEIDTKGPKGEKGDK